jgi:hypothetical protein
MFDVYRFIKKYRIYDILCLALLLTIGLYTFSYLFNSQPFVYDDNSFHYFSLYYAVTQSIPIHHRLVDWSPYWFAGIPELQFYPPGSIYIGIMLYYLTLTLIPIGQIYNLVLLFALLFPALTSYFLIRKSGFSQIAGFFTGLFFLILLELGNASGVFYSVLVGLTNSRIALGFYPLILWFGIKNLTPKPKKRYLAGLAVLVGFAVLCHPYHIFLPIFGLIALIYTFRRSRLCSFRKAIKHIGLAILLGVGLSSFWWLPLFIRHNFVSSLQIWSGEASGNQLQALLDMVSSLAHGRTNFFFICLYLLSAFSILNPQMAVRQRSILAGLVLTPVLMLGFLVFVQAVLIPYFHFYFLDVVRLKDGFHFAVILTSGIGVGYLISNLALSISDSRLKQNMVYRLFLPAILSIILCFIVWFTAINLRLFYNFTQGYARMGFLPQMVESYQLDDLWAYLSKSQIPNPKSQIETGRILFTASSLKYKNLPSRFQTHVLSLTPIYTNRQIIGGLNTPFYTIASYLFFGQKAPMVIRQEADMLDNKSMLGIPWEQMVEPRFLDFCRKLNITDIVVNQNEDKVLDFFSRSSSFRLAQEIDEFKIYAIPNYTPSWIEFDTTNADISVTSLKADSITLSVNSAATTTPVLIKIAYYPCWQATLMKSQSASGGPNPKSQIRITSDEIGLMQLMLPPGSQYQVELVYHLGWVEKLGWLITFLSFIVIFLIFAVKSLLPSHRGTEKTFIFL